jgi:hypothetical protein
MSATAHAEHTNPRERQAETTDPGTTELITNGEGEWEFIRNFPPNPGTDLKFFKRGRRLFAATGTLGQANEQHVGQRIIQLINHKGQVKPKWIADHGSSACEANPSPTSLQHDQILVPRNLPRLLIDATDAAGRCHDTGGGGLEIVAVNGDIYPLKNYKPREIHLTRHAGTSHTVTLDDKRPWIVYNNASESAGRPWIDVLDIRSCLKRGTTLGQKRNQCRPKVYRIYFKDEWAQRIDADGDRLPGTESSCHDITSVGNRLFCANLNSTIILNVKNLTTDSGRIRGTPLKCKLVDGTDTRAKVTDCSDQATTGNGQAKGWNYIGHVNHPGRNGNHNSNTEYESTEGVAVAHEADPTPNGKWVFVTDERGGGIVPGGASCTGEDPFGNGGVHVFRVRNGELRYARDPEGNKAVFIGEAVIPQATFCTAHVMEQIKGEQRFSIAWYTQGTKIVDYFIEDGKWTFREIASAVPTGPAANTWASQIFKKKRNGDGTVTYWFLASDITRGIDIFKWTGPANPMGSPPPAQVATSEREREDRSGNVVAAALLFVGAAPALARARRRLSRRS